MLVSAPLRQSGETFIRPVWKRPCASRIGLYSDQRTQKL